MARIQSQFLILSVLVIALAFVSATADPYGKSTTPKPCTPAINADVVVEGMVYCQSCKQAGTWSLNDAKPIAGAKISVICRNFKSRISYYKVFTTSEEGYFYAELQNFAMKHPLLDHPLHSCAVKLVSSPLENCNEFTNLNYGIRGAPLRSEKKRIMTKDYEAVIYAAGPLAFINDECPPEED